MDHRKRLPLLQQLRLAHWIKNGIIFLPAFFAGRIFHLAVSQYTVLFLTFIAFSATASAVYALNDILDLEHDRQHVVKRLRPLANGLLSRGQVAIISGTCLLAALVCMWMLPLKVSITLGGYFLLNLLYCFWLKLMPIIDVSCISAGFLLRLAAGGIIAAAPLSHWIVIITFLLMFSVALAKRRDDLVLSAGNDLTFRSAQAGYNKQFIDTAKGVSFAVTLVAYILYTVSPEVMARLGSPHVYVTALPVFLGIMRYLQLSIVQERTGDPVRLLIRDPFLLLMVLAWAAIFYYLIYV